MPVTTLRPATENQLGFLNNLRRERGLAIETWREFSARNLSTRDASREIDALKATPRAANVDRAIRGGLFHDLPKSKYAIIEDGVRTFWEIKEFRGTTYLRLLVGAPGDFRRVRVEFPRTTRVVAEIRRDPHAAALAFAQHYTCCAVCGADLSDETSVALGLGPICRQRFGL